jgi:hypothetical protein
VQWLPNNRFPFGGVGFPNIAQVDFVMFANALAHKLNKLMYF